MWWLARGESHLPTGLAWLSPAEAGHAAGMRFAKRRSEFLIARWAAKNALARFLSVPATVDALGRIEIRHAPTGAPRAWVDGRPADVRLSLTDRAGWAVCLVSDAPGPVGCDLELVEERSTGFVADFLTSAERDYVESAANSDGRHLAANLIWSAKESGLKVLETGLRRDTRSVEVTVTSMADGWNRLSVRTAEGPEFPGWWSRFGEFVLTVATEAGSPEPVELDDPPLLRDAVPAHSWLGQPLSRP